MTFARIPPPANEPVRLYGPQTEDRAKLEAALKDVAREKLEIPVVAGDKHLRTKATSTVVMPHDHGHPLAVAHHAGRSEVRQAIDAAREVAPSWATLPFEHRASIFLKAADLLSGPWRYRINAACMLGQSKTVHQAEIDAACELADFLRFNVSYAERLAHEQPTSSRGTWNRLDYRPLEGFVLAVTPFNFLAIAVNLPTAPALMGNVVLWKPATQTLVGAWHALRLLKEAGLPDGVISLLPGDGPEQGEAALDSEHLAGVHFTGSTRTFQHLWQGVGERLSQYRAYPRIVGETGGKDFLVVHRSADIEAAAVAVVRGGYEYQGQKCSALSRLYVPKSQWPALRDRVVDHLSSVKVGDVRDFSNFMGAVIDERAFGKIAKYLELARKQRSVLHGGTGDKSQGWFIQPTLVQVDDPQHRLMREEIFGPVVTAWVYPDEEWSGVLEQIDRTSPYGLTGGIFAQDRRAIAAAEQRLRHAAGNFYINDKPTGAVVGQQPFGGARASGTNDKAGSLWNLVRWTSPRAIKENFTPPRDWRYPSME